MKLAFIQPVQFSEEDKLFDNVVKENFKTMAREGTEVDVLWLKSHAESCIGCSLTRARHSACWAEEAKIWIEQWRKEYNQIRPHSALHYRPPAPETILTRATT